MSFDMKELIQPNEFVTIVDNSLEEEFKIKEGQVVFVAGMQAAPSTEEDPYLQQVYCLLHMLDENEDVIIDEGFFVVHPKILKKVSEAEQEQRMEQFKALIETIKEDVVLQ